MKLKTQCHYCTISFSIEVKANLFEVIENIVKDLNTKMKNHNFRCHTTSSKYEKLKIPVIDEVA